MSLIAIKNFLIYLSIGLVTKVIFGNEISFFIATGLSDLDLSNSNSCNHLIRTIILINILMFIYRIINIVYLEMGNF
jgi:hypothetical protein